MRSSRDGQASVQATEEPTGQAQPAPGPASQETAHPAEAGPAAPRTASGQEVTGRLPIGGRLLLLLILLDFVMTALFL
jgi:hypothetical protein